MRSLKLIQVLQIAAILSAALGLKYFYSVSSVNELRWILAPTTFLVETITGIQFRFESSAGYLSDDRSFLIAQPCSGVNFLIIAFLMLAIGNIRREWRWRSIPLAAGVAFVATLIANTTRIVIALKMRGLDLGYDYEDVHRIEGIVVYFGFLLLLFLASERYAGVRHHGRPSSMLRQASVPLLVYYAVTLGIPLVRGGFREREFWNHALVVIAIPLVLLMPFVILGVSNACGSGANESTRIRAR